MALSSMTGFARGHGVAGSYAWSWELKSVNAKGLDLRLRLPPGWDAIEVPARARAAEKLARGTVYANLTVERKGVAPRSRSTSRCSTPCWRRSRACAARSTRRRRTLDGILALKGVIEVTEEDEREEDRRAAEAAVLAGFDKALADLVAMRREEGATLGRLLSARLAEIAALAARAEAAPGRKPEAIKARLAEQVATLLSASQRFDPDRLHQEAIMLASKADMREELDRLRLACRAGAEADRRRRRGRPPARFPGAGTQPRIQYALRQGERRRPHQYRPRAQERGRAVPRAGAEPGVSAMAQRPRPGRQRAIARRGLMLVLSSPSGAGKTTLSRRLLEQDTGVTLSVSVTTRKMRPGEVDGRDYHFIDRARFDALVEKDALLEWAEVFDNYYGTPAKPGDGRAGGRARRAVRHRLAGHPAIAREGARRSGQRVRAAAVDARARAAACTAARRTITRPSTAAWPRPPTR